LCITALRLCISIATPLTSLRMGWYGKNVLGHF
jgi:hypothetical protein